MHSPIFVAQLGKLFSSNICYESRATMTLTLAAKNVGSVTLRGSLTPTLTMPMLLTDDSTYFI